MATVRMPALTGTDHPQGYLSAICNQDFLDILNLPESGVQRLVLKETARK